MYKCNNCDYTTEHKGNYNKHIKSTKHKKEYECNCGRAYLHRQSYYRHKIKCNKKDDIIIKLIEENAKLNQTILEIIPKIGHKININVFLQEKCNNAINLTDFIKSIDISMEDIEKCPDQGIVVSIGNTLVNALSNLDIYERPIHCSDKKRATLYIKENNKWDKDIELVRIKDAIDIVSYKQFLKFKEWVTMHPEEENIIKMANQLSKDLEKDNSYRKIINQVSNEVYIQET
jgi:Rad3-related DNA helicase